MVKSTNYKKGQNSFNVIATLAIGWIVPGLFTGGGEGSFLFSMPVQADPEAHPSSSTMCTGAPTRE